MLKKFTNTKDKKVLISNFLYLSILQGANYILPLITIPYLVRVLGIEYFGLLAFATATITYFNIIVDYGFNLTATREISVHRDNILKITEIYSSVMIIKFILICISFALLIIITLNFDKFREYNLIYILTFGVVIGQFLFPVWFFQGMEKMKYITYVNLFSKFIFTLCIFIFINSKSDIYLVPILNSVGYIIAGLYSLIIIRKDFNIRFSKQDLPTIMYYFVQAWHVFVSRIAVVLYTTSNIFILGLFTNNTIVGSYSIAEKVISAINSFSSVLSQVFFPYLSRIWISSRQEYYKKFELLVKLLILGMIFCAVIGFLFANILVTMVVGSNNSEITDILRILLASLVFYPLGSWFTGSFISQKSNIYVTKSTMYTSLSNVIIVFPLIYFYSLYGLAITVLLVQMLHTYINIKYYKLLKHSYLT